jgi:hypothetical protein
MIDPPVRPARGEVLDPATFGRPAADTVIRRYSTAAERDADVAGIPLDELAGQVTTLTAGVAPRSDMHDGSAWRPTRVGSKAWALFRARVYPQSEFADPNRYVELAPEPNAVAVGNIGIRPSPTGGPYLMGPEIRITGRYLIEMTGTMWRHEFSTGLYGAWIQAIAGHDPFYDPFASRVVGEGGTGTPDWFRIDPQAYTWSYRSHLATVAELAAGEAVGMRYVCQPDPSAPLGGYVRPAGEGIVIPGVGLGIFSIALLAPI